MNLEALFPSMGAKPETTQPADTPADSEKALASLFPSMSKPTPKIEGDPTAALYPSMVAEDVPELPVPDSIRELRDAGDRPGIGEYREVAPMFQPVEGKITEAQAKAADREVRNMFADMNLTSPEAATLVNAARDPQPVAYDAAIQGLLPEFGGNQQAAERALQAARALVQRDPRLLAVMEQRGLGSDLRVIKALANAGHRAILRGKVKV